jgi:hypothetical protein
MPDPLGKGMDAETRRTEVDRNFAAFRERLPTLIQLHRGKFALMRDGEVVEIYSDWTDAFRTAERFFEDGRYSIQKITDTPVDLGFFSHAVHIR